MIVHRGLRAPAMRPDKHIGTVIGGYALEAMIGWGKSSKVYRARHQLTGHVQAIKVITKAQSHVGYARVAPDAR